MRDLLLVVVDLLSGLQWRQVRICVQSFKQKCIAHKVVLEEGIELWSTLKLTTHLLFLQRPLHHDSDYNRHRPFWFLSLHVHLCNVS